MTGQRHAAGQAPMDGQIAPRIDEGRFHAQRAQTGDGSVHGHPLGDTAQIQAHPRRQGDAAVAVVDRDAPPAAARTRQPGRGRDPRRQRREGPVVPHRHEVPKQGRVIEAIRGLRCLQGCDDDLVQQRAHGHRFPGVPVQGR